MLTAPFLLTQAVWPDMVELKSGRIVNIASIHALVASPHKAAYVSAKHGLLGLTRVAGRSPDLEPGNRVGPVRSSESQ